MKTLFWGYNGLLSLLAMALWFLAPGLGFTEPTTLFVGVAVGLLIAFAVAHAKTPAAGGPFLVVLLYAVSWVVALLVPAASIPQTFVVLVTFGLFIASTERVLGKYPDDGLWFLGVPSFTAFVWFINLGVWWGIGMAAGLFAVQFLWLLWVSRR